MTPNNLSGQISALFDAERAVRERHSELADAEPSILLAALQSETGTALKLDDEDEAALRLVRLAGLLAEVEGAESTDCLIDILGASMPEARHAAGEVLEDLAYDRFKEVALGVERALERLDGTSPALVELPYLLVDIPEPGVTKLLGRFLSHANSDVVASGIEALAELGDPSAAPLMVRLERDKRTVRIEEEDGDGTVTIGELAQEARKLLSERGRDTGRRSGRSSGPGQG